MSGKTEMSGDCDPNPTAKKRPWFGNYLTWQASKPGCGSCKDQDSFLTNPSGLWRQCPYERPVVELPCFAREFLGRLDDEQLVMQ